MEKTINACIGRAQQTLHRKYTDCKHRIRQSPTSCVLGAVAAGYCLNRLPVRALVVANVRLISALAKPALVLFGAAKAYEFLQRRNVSKKP